MSQALMTAISPRRAYRQHDAYIGAVHRIPVLTAEEEHALAVRLPEVTPTLRRRRSW